MSDAANLKPFTSIRPLVVRTEPYSGESLSSVLVRSCEANVFTKTMHLLGLIGLPAQASESVAFTHTSSAPRIAKLLGTSAETIKSLMHPPVDDQFERICVDWFGSPIERRHITATLRRFAPSSLEESRHHKAIWMVTLLDYCPVSMELLVTQCPQCSRPLGWRACRSLEKCDKCGASLAAAKTRTLPPHLHEVARLGAALVSPFSAERKMALSALPKPFSTWAPADALFSLITLGKAEFSIRPTIAHSANGVADFIDAGIEFIQNWPDSLMKFTKLSTTKNGSPSVKKGLGSLGKLFNNDTKDSPIRNLLRSSIPTSFSKAAIPVKLTGRLFDGNCREGRLTAMEASKELGISSSCLRRLEGQSKTFLARHKVKGGPALYDKEAIMRLKNAFLSGQRPNACAHHLGVPIYCIKKFVLANILQEIDDIDAIIVTGDILISKLSLINLKKNLKNASSRIDQGVSLSAAMRRNCNPNDWAWAFTEILSGIMSFEFQDHENFSVSENILVDARIFTDRFSQRSIDHNIGRIFASCDNLSEFAHLKPGLIAELVRREFIKGKLDRHNSEISVEDFVRFQNDYILGGEISEIIGGNWKSIDFRLREAGHMPAATIKGTHVWRRSDVEDFIEMQKI